jgi:hypothetical protein
MTTRSKSGQTHPSAMRQLEGRLYRWRKRYARAVVETDRADRAYQRALMRACESRRRLLMAEAALSAAKEMG